MINKLIKTNNKVSNYISLKLKKALEIKNTLILKIKIAIKAIKNIFKSNKVD